MSSSPATLQPLPEFGLSQVSADDLKTPGGTSDVLFKTYLNVRGLRSKKADFISSSSSD